MAEKETADSDSSATDEKRPKVKLKKLNGWKALSEKFGEKDRSVDAPQQQESPSVGSLEIFKFAEPLDICLIVIAMLLCKYTVYLPLKIYVVVLSCPYLSLFTLPDELKK